jgi:hypothetical protein
VIGLMSPSGEVLASTKTWLIIEPSRDAPAAAPGKEARADVSPTTSIADIPAATLPEARPVDPQITASTEVAPAAEPKPAPAQPLPSSGKLPAVTTLEAAALKGLISRGEQQMALGNIVVARQFLKRAADAGSADAALMMGDTYEADELVRLGAIGIAPDPAQARRWYERARDLGAVEPAKERLERLRPQ